MKTRTALLFLLMCGAVAACTLDATPPPAPSIEHVFETPAAIEQTILTGYQACRSSIVGGQTVQPLLTMSLEGSGPGAAAVARAAIPREVLTNAPGAPSFHDDYKWLGTGGRLAANAVRSLRLLMAQNGTLGGLQQDLRALAFGYFNVGCHQGWAAMIYDSVAVVTPAIAPEVVPALSGAAVAMDSAIAMLDSAIAIAQRADTTIAGGFPIPATWMNTAVSLSPSDFVRVARSFRARFRAGVARTPAQRAAVAWAAVIADADSGIAGDFLVTVVNNTPWFGGAQVSFNGLMGMASFYYGMADVSGAYDLWLAAPLAERDMFLIVTPDRRWPQGSTRAAQQAASVTPTSLASRPYIRNRPTDVVTAPYTNTFYQWVRNEYVRTAPQQTGPFAEITRAELNLLAAEGYYRTGNLAAAANRIDITRVARGGLPALSGVVTTTTQLVPGGTSCVPRVPQSPAFTSTACGTLLEALKWEKRMETAWTGFSQWFFDGRGWGDLPEGTALEFPVPYQELQARQKPFYSLGGGLASSAAKGTYGF